MSATVTIEEAQASLKDLVHRLAPGEEVIITEDEKPIARLVSDQPQPAVTPRPAPGFLKGRILFMAPDFNDPLDDLKEYME